MLDTTGDLEEGTHGSGLGRVGVRTQCTDPCFLELTRMDCAETEGSGAPATCQEVDVSKGKPGVCVGLQLMSMAEFCPHRAQHRTRSGWGHWGSQASV